MGPVFELSALLSLNKDSYDKGMDEAESKAEKGGNKIGKGLASAAKTTMKATAAAIGAAAVAVSAVVKKSVDAYAEYEQLAGGVNKLFGDGSSEATYAVDVVMENARNAWKTAGMSMNDYMDTVTGFSASLINSLGGDQVQAAAYADMAIRSMSDNANTFGTDIESIRSAYSGFAKQNYTMLDNLKLGYGGTKEEMERLIADANEYAAANGMAANMSIDSFADIVQAIELIQQKQGVAGTTAKEAAGTIEGSLNSAKAAWENLLVGIADPDQDFGALIDNFVGAAGNVVQNIAPRIATAIEGVGKLIQELVPVLVETIPPLLESLLPMLLDSAMGLFEQLVSALPQLIQLVVNTLVGAIPQIVESLTTALPALIDGISAMLPSLISGITSLIGSLSKSLPKLVSKFIPALINGFTQLITTVLPELPSIIASQVEGITGLFTELIPQLIPALIEGLVLIAESIVQNIPAIFSAIVDGFVSIGESIIEAFRNIDWSGLWEGIKNTSVVQWFIGAWDSVSTFFTKTLPEWATGAWTAIKTGVTTFFAKVGDWFEEAWATLTTFFTTTVPDWATGAWNAIKTGITTAFAAIGTVFRVAWSAVSTFFTSTIPTWASRAWATIKSAISTVFSKIGTIFSNAWGAVKTFFSTTIVGWAKGAWTSIKAAVSGAFAGIKTIFKTAWQGVSDFFTTDLPDWATGAWDAIKTGVSGAFDAAGEWFTGAWSGISTFFTETIPGWATSAWNGIKSVFAKIANWAIDNVINPIIDGINWAFGWLGVDIGHVQRIKVEGEEEFEENDFVDEDGHVKEGTELYAKVMLEYENSGVLPDGYSFDANGRLVADKITREVELTYTEHPNSHVEVDPDSGIGITVTEGYRPKEGRATGLTYVPYDNYAVMLHKGERILDANEASRYNSVLNGGGGVTTTLSIGEYHVHDGSDVQTLVDMLTNEQMRNMRAMGVRA